MASLRFKYTLADDIYDNTRKKHFIHLSKECVEKNPKNGSCPM
jgi:hypothetical protein